MINKNNCPDCGAAVGQPHRNECDVELCSVCREQRICCDCNGHDPMAAAWTGEWPKQEDAGHGFVIYDDVGSNQEVEASKGEQPTILPWSDDMHSANARRVSKMFLAEPVYRDEKPTGEWRVFRIRIPRDYCLVPSRKIPWTVLPSKDAADEWIENLLKGKQT